MISPIYNIINLGAFLGLVYYFFRKNYKSRLENEMAQRVEALENLKKEYRSVVDRQAHLDNKQIYQEAQFKTLLLKVERWRETFDARQKEKVQRRRMITNQLAEKRAHVGRIRALHASMKAAGPRVLNEVERSLIVKYQMPGTADQYIEHVLRSLDIKNEGGEQ